MGKVQLSFAFYASCYVLRVIKKLVVVYWKCSPPINTHTSVAGDRIHYKLIFRQLLIVYCVLINHLAGNWCRKIFLPITGLSGLFGQSKNKTINIYQLYTVIMWSQLKYRRFLPKFDILPAYPLPVDIFLFIVAVICGSCSSADMFCNACVLRAMHSISWLISLAGVGSA